MARSRPLNLLIVFALLASYGVAIVLVVHSLSAPQTQPSLAPQLVAEGKADLLDAAYVAWQRESLVRATRTQGLLRQLDGQVISSAAEATLMLFLQNELKGNPWMGEFAILDAQGKLIVSTDGTHVGKTLSRRDALRETVPAQMLLGSRGPSLRRYLTEDYQLASWLRPDWLAQFRKSSSGASSVLLVDANGQVWGQSPSSTSTPLGAEALALGTRTHSGQVSIAGFDVGYAPVQGARWVVLSLVERPLEMCFWKSWGSYLGAGVGISALLLTLFVGRLFRIRR